MDLSIVIVSWNTCDLLLSCLTSVYNYSPACRFEIWVVDNASSDGSTEMIRRRFPQVQLIENQENFGFARGNNQAILRSAGKYILLLNPDTEVKSGALEALLKFMEENPHAGAAGARLVNPDGTLQNSCYRAPTLTREIFRLFHLESLIPNSSYLMAEWMNTTHREVDIAQGACLILRRQALDQIGLLDEEYFIYSEEVDLCYRLRKAGWKIYWVPQAEVIHYGDQSTRQVPTEMFLRLYESKILYFRKHHGWMAVKKYKLILLAATLTRLMISPLVWLEQPTQRRKHLMLANRYWQLMKALQGF